MRDHAARRRELIDHSAVRLVAWARVLTALAVAAYGSVTDPADGRLRAFFLVVSLLVLPLAVVVLPTGNGSRRHVVQRIGAPVGDLGATFALQTLAGPFGAALAPPAYLLVTAYGAYTDGRAGGLVIACVALALSALGGASLTTLSVTTAVALVMVLLFERSRHHRSEAEARTQRVEGKSQAILSRVASAVVVTDAGGVIEEWNDAAATTITGGREASLRGQCAEVLGLRAGERLLDCSRGCALLAAGGDSGTRELWRPVAGGRRQPLLVDAVAVRDGDGSVVEVVHSLRDVTALKQADEAKTMFLATASHELKTPLTVIGGFAELLLSVPDMPEAGRVDALRTIHRRTEELSAIVDRLLLSSRIEAGRVQLTLGEVDVAALVRERVEAFEQSTARTIELDVESPAAGLADARALRTVVDHLVDNAMRYSPNGDPVQVQVRAGGGHAAITVTDTGIGMTSEQLERCFDKFWQAESSDVRRFGGTGIGLYIVRSLVEAMDGQITVASAPDDGTTFRVLLRTSPATGRGEPERMSIGESIRQLGIQAGGAS